jgi:predicted amino acid racemase
MGYPFIKINPAKITANTRAIADMCHLYGIDLVGVTKAACADVIVAQAMLDGGAQSLGDSRIQNLKKLRLAGINSQLMLLRIPMLSEAMDVVTTANISLISELATATALSKAAVTAGVHHKIILMVDMGDLREGILPQKILPYVRPILNLPGIELIGLGTNFACYGGLIPTPAILETLIELAENIRTKFSIDLPIISGGNSANIDLLYTGRLPSGVTNLRIGEAILLGRETINRSPIPGTYQDAFTLCTEIIEVQEKPSIPMGQTGQNAFGQHPHFIDHGIRRKAIAAIGRQDISIEGVEPLQPGIKILGGSSDHLILDVSDSPDTIDVGSEIDFSVKYSALVPIMVSPYVTKIFV